MPRHEEILALLEPAHLQLGEGYDAYAREQLLPLPEPVDDEDARRQARDFALMLGQAGWFAPIAGQDFRACCLAREALAYASPLADAVFALQALCATPIILAGSEEQKATWLPRIIAGEAMGAFAMTEPGAGSDVSAIATTAVRDGDSFILHGEKAFISNAGIADLYIVFASTEPERKSRGLSLFLVPADTPGLDFAGAQVMASPHPLGKLELRDCRVPASALIGEYNKGFHLGMATLDGLRSTVGAAAAGMAARALDEATAHVLRREQFGQPLAEFQLVQQRLARMVTDLVAARLVVYRAVWDKDRGVERISVQGAMAKSFATETAFRIVDDAVQLHGGKGILAETAVDRLYRTVRSLRIYEGTTEVQQLVIGAHWLKTASRG